MKPSNLIPWALFVLLSLIWGSSFILIKGGLNALSSYQTAALRLVSAGLVLLPSAIKAFRKIPTQKLPLIFLSGMLGSFMPAFLFCFAEETIDSALAGVLNALTPVFVIIIGALFFKAKTPFRKILGVAIAFSGTFMLSFINHGTGQSNFLSILFVLMATMMYAINVYVVSHYLKDIQSTSLAAMSVVLNSIPALPILYFSGFFNHDFGNQEILQSVLSAALLGVLGTAVASILFYALLRIAGPVFSSMVTYAIPIVAIFWGLYFGEQLTTLQLVAFAIVIAGVFIANRPERIVFKKT